MSQLFTHPRPLSFYSPEYAIANGGTETPITYQGRTYLYVVHRKTRQQCYYCWESDTFSANDCAPWQPH